MLVGEIGILKKAKQNKNLFSQCNIHSGTEAFSKYRDGNDLVWGC